MDVGERDAGRLSDLGKRLGGRGVAEVVREWASQWGRGRRRVHGSRDRRGKICEEGGDVGEEQECKVSGNLWKRRGWMIRIRRCELVRRCPPEPRKLRRDYVRQHGEGGGNRYLQRE